MTNVSGGAASRLKDKQSRCEYLARAKMLTTEPLQFIFKTRMLKTHWLKLVDKSRSESMMSVNLI